jgi:hypothetical protein
VVELERIKKMSRGVIYAHAGTSCLTRLIVSLHSLRNHWNGYVTIFQEGEPEPELVAICRQLYVKIEKYDPVDLNNYTKKCHVNTLAPYENNVFLDADTIVVNPIDKYFDWVEKYGLVFTNFCNWTPKGNIMTGRIRKWESLYPEAVESALNYPVALNTGTYGFKKDHPFLEGWLETSTEGGKNGVPLTDELAAQLLCQFFQHYVAPPPWNYSVKYGESISPIEEAVIIHFHGRKHIGTNKCQKMWRHEFNAANKKWGLKAWRDKRVRKMMGGKDSVFKLELHSEVQEDPEPDPKTVELSKEVTYVTAVDKRYLPKLKSNFESWRDNEKVFDHPVIVYYDENSVKEEELDFLPDHVRKLPWSPPLSWEQRERMLTVFVLKAPYDVGTPYWIKLDADVTATSEDAKPTWQGDWKEFAVVGHKWGYTKPKGGKWPKHWLNILDDWWNELTGEEPIFPEIENIGGRYGHGRIASFYCFHNTERTRELADMMGDRLPIPSHDTVLWYVAERKQWPMKRMSMKRRGLKP